MLGTVTLDGTGAATFSTSTLPVGIDSITAEYGGDGSFLPSSVTISQQVEQGASSITLTSSQDPSVLGQSVTFTVNVAAASATAGTPTGTVSFYDGTTLLDTETLDGNGDVSFSTGTLPLGSDSITADYSGDSTFLPSSASLTQQVDQDASTLTLTASANPAVWGQNVTFTATVSPVSPATGMPSGTVTFYDGDTLLGTVTLDGNGEASFSSSTLPLGSDSITAQYSGDSDFLVSNTTLSEQVDQASSITTLTSSANPAVWGQDVTFTAIVSAAAPGAGTPTGVVNFYDGGTLLDTETLDGTGQASFTTSTLGEGTHDITAAYEGDTDFTPSVSSILTQTIQIPASDTTLTLAVNESADIDLNTIATSPNGNPLSFTIVQQPANGTLTYDPTFDAYDYVPNHDFTGNDSFTYQANDGIASSNVATVSINVIEIAPIIADQSDTVAPNQTTGIPLDTSWAASGDNVTVTIVQQPSNGTLAYNTDTGLYDYTPAQGYLGDDSFTYQVSDGIQTSNVATVSITVADPNPPVADNQSLTVLPDQSTNFRLLGNATPISGCQLTTTIVTQPSNGTVVFDATKGVYTYTPDQGFTGTDSLTWKVNDGILDSNVATVSITVSDPAPIAFDGAVVAIAGQAITLNLADAGLAAVNNPLTVSIVQAPSNGTLVADAQAGQYDYVANATFSGSDSFTFTVNDGFQTSNVATVSILVLPPVPVASNATVSAPANQTTEINLLNDVSAGGSTNPLTLQIVQGPTNGTLVYNTQTQLYDYTPTRGFTGTDTFTFQAINGDQISNVATISVNVLPPAPVANATAVTATSGTATTFNLSSAVAAPIGSSLAFTVVQPPTQGSLSYSPSTGQCTYTPNQGSSGTDSFTYKVTSGTQVSNVATVSITLAGAPAAPAAATITWTGAVNNDWFNTGNWDIGRLPSEQDNVVINSPNANISTTNGVGDTILVNSLSLQAGGLTVADGVTLTVESSDGTTPSSLLVSGGLAVSGILNLDCAVTLNGGNFTVARDGFVYWIGGTITSQSSTFTNDGTFTSESGASWNALDTFSSVEDDGLFDQHSGTTTLNIRFDVNGNNGEPFAIDGEQCNPGFVWIEQGTLQLADKSGGPFATGTVASSTGGTFLVEQDGTLDFHGGNYILDASSAILGDGTVHFSGCCWEDSGAYNVGTTDITNGYRDLRTP